MKPIRISVRIISVLMVLGLFLIPLPSQAKSESNFQTLHANIRLVRTIEADKTGIVHPAGLFYMPGLSTLGVVEDRGSVQMPASHFEVIHLTPFGDRAGSTLVNPAIQDPINIVYDNLSQSFIIYQSTENQIIHQQAGQEMTGSDTVQTRIALPKSKNARPQGMALSPGDGDLFILDSNEAKIIHVHQADDARFGNYAITDIHLKLAGITDLTGLALDPLTGHFYLVNSLDKLLYEVDKSGEVVSLFDLTKYDVVNPQGLTFAPSGDQTDDPSLQNLYLADDDPSGGRIFEFSFALPVDSVMGSYQSNLIRTVNTNTFTPPSPDPSGLAYIPSRNSLMITDGEIEEIVAGITHFAGANIWETSLAGVVQETANISSIPPSFVPMTNEPTGIAWNPNNGHYYVTDDNGYRIYDLDPGLDGQYGTTDDRWTSFRTLTFGSGDPEGITYDTWHNTLFVVDGLNAEVYQYTTSGSLISQFDVQALGVEDPESVEFNPYSGTLFVLSNSGNPIIIETDTNGGLLNIYDFSTVNVIAPAGLTYAPASDGSNMQRFYILDRGIDNNDNPNIIDGKLYELTAPQSTPPGNTPPVVNAGNDQNIIFPESVTLTGVITDDGLPNPPGSVTYSWSQLEGPGIVLFENANVLVTSASFTETGHYILCLTASDGELTGNDCLTISVITEEISTVETRVSSSRDDAEESSSGYVYLTSGDLELVFDGTNQVVGLRFINVSIPQNASIITAYIQFKVDEVTSEATNLSIFGEASENPALFNTSSRNISVRRRTSSSITWSPSAWSGVGLAGPEQRTPDISSIVQEVVTRPGWTSGNAMVFILTGTGRRTAEAFEGDPNGAPLLHVEYSSGQPTNTPPIASIQSPANGVIFNSGSPITFTGNAIDAQDGNITDSLVWMSSLNGQIGTGGSFVRSDLSVGTHIITATSVDSGGLTNSTQVDLTISAGNQAPMVDAGQDQVLIFPNIASLHGLVSDDSLPNPPGSITTTWSMVNGPGVVTFTGVNTLDTTASFSSPGTYVLRLSAFDGSLTSVDDVVITLNPMVSDLIFADSFETGSVNAWSDRVTDKGNLSVSTTAAIIGNWGLQAVINDNTSIYVIDNLPSAEVRYRGRFYFDPNTIQMANNNAHYIFRGNDSNGTAVVRIELRFNNGYEIRGNVINNSSSYINTTWTAISDSSHCIELDWRASDSAAANNGGLTLWIDGLEVSTLSAVANETRRIESIRLGPMSGIDNETRGTMFFDAYESRRQTYIGP